MDMHFNIVSVINIDIKFDKLTSEMGAFKLEIIGDAFVCAGGLRGQSCGAEQMVKLALALIDASHSIQVNRFYVKKSMKKKTLKF